MILQELIYRSCPALRSRTGASLPGVNAVRERFSFIRSVQSLHSAPGRTANLATRLIRQIGVPLDESRHLQFNRLCQKTPRDKA